MINELDNIKNSIYSLRNKKVILSHDLARLYQVEVRTLMQAVKRNIDRFPEDFMFQLTVGECESLRSQFVILEKGKGQHSKYLPYAFTQEGIAMLSSVLRSSRAIDVNIAIMRTFVRLREMMLVQSELEKKINSLERKYDSQFKVVFNSIRELIRTEIKENKTMKKNKIGFCR